MIQMPEKDCADSDLRLLELVDYEADVPSQVYKQPTTNLSAYLQTVCRDEKGRKASLDRSSRNCPSQRRSLSLRFLLIHEGLSNCLRANLVLCKPNSFTLGPSNMRSKDFQMYDPEITYSDSFDLPVISLFHLHQRCETIQNRLICA